MPIKNSSNSSSEEIFEVKIPSGYYYLNDEFILIKAEGFPGVIKMKYTGDLWNWWEDSDVQFTDGKLIEKPSRVRSMYPLNGNNQIPEVDDLREFIKSKTGEDFKFDKIRNLKSIKGTKLFI